MNIQQCRDTTDASVLYLPQRLFLKPYAQVHISVYLPTEKVHNKSISNWELMEKLRNMIQPYQFSSLRVVKNSADCIRFEGELEVAANLEKVLSKIESRSLTLNGWRESLKVRAFKPKSEFPTRHSWDSFFRDAQNMDEMKPGERPDTIHIWNLPILWFTSSRDTFDDNPLPSESLFRKCFERFGKIRCIDIPICDPYRKEMKDHITGLNTSLYDPQIYFEAYIQFSEYVAYVRAMDALKDCKLVRKGEGGGAEAATIYVDFDRTKHMTDTSLKRRDMVRERLAARHRAKEEKEREEINKIAKREEQERRHQEQAELEMLEKIKDREERRKRKQLAKIAASNPSAQNIVGVKEEKKKLVKSIKRLQSVRLLEELFKRVQLKHTTSNRFADYGHKHKYRYVEAASEAARERIVEKTKSECEKEVGLQQDRYREAQEGRIVLRAALDKKKSHKSRSASMSSLSSDESISKKIKTEKITPEEAYGPGGPYGMMPYGFGFPPQYPGYAYPPAAQPMYYGNRVYYPPPDVYVTRGRGTRGVGGRFRGRGRGRFPYFHGPNASQEYYKYFKKLAEEEASLNHRGEHDDRHSRSYSRSRSRSRHRSRYTRSRSRSRTRSRSRRRRSSYTRSRSRSRRSRSRCRSHSRRSRSRRRSRTKSRSRSRRRHTPDKPEMTSERENKTKSPEPNKKKSRSKSWSLPKDGAKEKSWSKSPKKD